MRLFSIHTAVHVQAIRARCTQLINAAGEAGVKVLCLQEAWCVGIAWTNRYYLQLLELRSQHTADCY